MHGKRVIVLEMNRRESDWNLFDLSRILDNLNGPPLITADELHASIHDHLGRVGATETKTMRVIVLTNAELPRRIGIPPTDIVPVVDVFAKNDQLCVAHRLGAVQPFQ